MSINFATLQGLTIPEGVVTQIADVAGRIIWSAVKKIPAILEVAKSATTSSAGEVEYTEESVILLDIYPEKNATVKVTYGGLTKTVTDTSGADEPNALQVFFGTFQGVSDSVTTPDSGILTIEGNYRGYGRGAFSNSKGLTGHCACITGVVDMGNPEIIGDYTFYLCANLTLDSLPDSVTYIGANSFHGCTSLSLNSLPDGVTSIGDRAFYDCYNVCITEMPPNLTSIGSEAFYIYNIPINESGYSSFKLIAMFGKTITLPSTIQKIGSDAFATSRRSSADNSETYLRGVKMLAVVPPSISADTFGTYGGYYIDNTTYHLVITVLVGCGATYKAADGWSTYQRYIVEAS